MKIFIATPMYGGNAKSNYINSVGELIRELIKYGHEITQSIIVNESLITRARNTLAHDFLKSDCDALLFVDADHGFNHIDVIRMIESGKDLIGAIYPMKSINWENIKKAALSDIPAEELHLYSGRFAINFLSENQSFKANEPFKVRDIGTGMMFIKRRVFEELKSVVKTYNSNSVGSSATMGEKIYEFFTTMITDEPESILLSEDYAFCHMWRELGNDVWAAPWVRITHEGDYQFSGNFLRTLEIQNQAVEVSKTKSSSDLSQSSSSQLWDTIFDDSE